MNTHISYETAKRLKEFLGESAPDPMMGIMDENSWYGENEMGFICISEKLEHNDIPAYQLHDLLSKPFAETMFPKLGWLEARDVTTELFWAWEDGGLPAVEKALNEMIGGQNGK